MPRAEVGSTKHLSNKMKSKGLQRLRWYCQVCERQMRDENGFKCHVQSESHVRQMLLVGEDPKKHIARYSEDFKRDFLQLLRTSHGEKLTNLNHFYQEYIANKEHVHMNATKWPSLTEFAKYLGREGICRVEDVEGKGLHVGWIDNSPEALRRQDAIRAKERQDRGDEEREQRLIRQQVEKAQQEAKAEEEASAEARQLQREEGEKITLNFGAKPAAAKLASPSNENDSTEAATPAEGTTPESTSETAPASAAPAVKMSLNMGAAKPKNVFAAAKKNPLAAKKAFVKEPSKKMSEAERIMKEEIERKRAREAAGPGQGGFKRQKVA